MPGPGAGRQIVYTAEMQISTRQPDAAVARAEQLTAAAGGYVGDETSGNDGGIVQPQQTAPVDGGPQPSAPLAEPTGPELSQAAQLVLRVPAGSFDSVYHRLAALGTVLGQQRSAQDVTAQVADVDSRVASARASVQRIRDLMAKAQTISDLTELESVLTQRESDLESLEAQQKALQDQAAMSTLTLVVYRPEPAAPTGRHTSSSGVGGALAGGWHAFVATVRWIVSALAAALPFLGVAAVIAGLWVWRARRRRAAAPEPPEPLEAPGPFEPEETATTTATTATTATTEETAPAEASEPGTEPEKASPGGPTAGEAP